MTASGPTALPATYTVQTPALTLAAAGHDQMHENIQDELRAIWTRLGLTAAPHVPLKIGEAVGTGSSGVLEVASIPATFRSLYFELDGGRSSAAVTNATVRMTVESSPTSGAYNNQRLYAGATALAADENIGASDFINLGIMPGASSTANLVGSICARVPGYANTTPFKTVHATNVGPSNIATGEITALVSGGVIELTAAIDRIRLTLSTGNWTSTSRLTVWGMPT